jgi:hypothetical protein
MPLFGRLVTPMIPALFKDQAPLSLPCRILTLESITVYISVAAMGVDPPFLYDRPSSSSFAEPTGKSFNPKSVSQASWAPRPPRPKQTGPLISAKELNRHPDSFFASYVFLSLSTSCR